MKTLLILFFSFVIFHGFSQEEVIPENAPKQDLIVEIPAEFPGGMAALRKYLAENMRYPLRAVEAEIQGKVWLRFIINTDGEIENVTIQRGITDCPECDAEAKRLVEAMPDWIPGKDEKGEAVRSYYSLPISFKLN